MVKKIRDGDKTQEKILNSARELFVEHGYTGISMAKIAAKAGVNHSLLFHHFKNKLNLWTEVKMDIIRQGTSVQSILPNLNQPFDTFLKELLTSSLDYYRKNPDLIRMTNWQRLDSHQEDSAGIGMTDEMKNWLVACQFFQEKGEIRKDIAPEFMITFVISLVSSAALDPNQFIKDPERLKVYMDFCYKAILKAITP